MELLEQLPYQEEAAQMPYWLIKVQRDAMPLNLQPMFVCLPEVITKLAFLVSQNLFFGSLEFWDISSPSPRSASDFLLQCATYIRMSRKESHI